MAGDLTTPAAPAVRESVTRVDTVVTGPVSATAKRELDAALKQLDGLPQTHRGYFQIDATLQGIRGEVGARLLRVGRVSVDAGAFFTVTKDVRDVGGRIKGSF